ncbi:uncharacterized protein BO66DRAFT_229552 [Aspergillus aculeatinus CBS 121060]|uniref:Uncharacterized protein n=1 Tax=Aspergillus aculeatinus CBS 121060 TaxID=1448322 RepID=A0ACD1GTY0_9EURO|nr:hypothetical protein BO66DRAFT_229552 [Aspergillus aculeatinus CBS 121060]RAH64826.1 hypothetical protein BO66DRAFT_229552 [Aspergillus aculeatinus CBS 121060]
MMVVDQSYTVVVSWFFPFFFLFFFCMFVFHACSRLRKPAGIHAMLPYRMKVNFRPNTHPKKQKKKVREKGGGKGSVQSPFPFLSYNNTLVTFRLSSLHTKYRQPFRHPPPLSSHPNSQAFK